MESDDELPEDEEEMLVYVEFEGLAGNDAFNNENLQLDMIGLDTEHPVMQINGRFYEGTYEDAMGTYMFFEKDDNPKVDDVVFDKVPSLKYFAKTRKLLKMQRVFTKPKVEVVGDSEHESCIPNTDTLSQAGVPPNYQKDAMKFWNKIRNDKLEELNTYLEKHKIREEKKSQDTPNSDEDNIVEHKTEENSEKV
ncbi:general transcription factor 3C polypeptide 6 [Pogonomyrmex barbatus]|uniref:General transcription factor 3C polypeptide 6 n=1 Tax=Pogonomyrmex barbatus TaxID=144034 RepID=A0A6I9WWL9_9HYME|nr:general transcription factor 3C polypeptide 6 [Pogonomyrmex barbatus]XP_011644335.1 general transcription factor 3C polypeptide 6 [Pogonomyrmex barbatus]XP_025075321.1 general transcription factor 3C polypeptide 6 [Pogonomyrmex barbatus]